MAAPALAPTAGVTRRIAEFVTGFPASDIPAAAIERANACLLDTAACILAGAASEEAHPLMAFLATRGTGASPILGTTATADPASAALVNGTFGHALDYDDVLSIMPAHPSTVILPAMLALAPQDAEGRALVEAYAIGIEVGARLGVAISNGHYRRGWHSTGTLAIFSATAALGRFLKLDTTTVQTAFGIAASLASGLQCNFGTMTKPLHAGWASHNAVTAVSLAMSGFTAAQNAFEAPAGFFSTYGAEQSDVTRAAENLGQPFALVEPGLALKKYPCCYALHRPIDAMIEIRKRLPVSPETVERVTARVAPGALRPLIHKVAHTGLQAKFSMEYTLAAGVLDGGFGLAAYSDAGAERAAIHALLPRIEAVEDPRCFGDDVDPSRRSAGTLGFVEVTVTLKDGRSETVRVDKPTGSPAHPLTAQDLADKFADCAREAALPDAQASAAYAVWREISAAPSVAAAAALLTRTSA